MFPNQHISQIHGHRYPVCRFDFRVSQSFPLLEVGAGSHLS